VACRAQVDDISFNQLEVEVGPREL
jgi:hypothetical protein